MQAASWIQAWVDEYDMASALLGALLEMVAGETNDILVPADSEIFLKGVIKYGTREPEGHFGESPGYLPGETTVFRASKSPASPSGTNRSSRCRSRAFPSTIATSLWASSSPGLGGHPAQGGPAGDRWDVFVRVGILWFVIRVPTDRHGRTGWTLDEFMRRIGPAFWSDHVGDTVTKILVVGEDIEPSAVRQIVWAFASCIHPTFITYLFPESQAFGDGIESFHTARELAEIKGTSLVVYACLDGADRVGRPEKRVMSFEANDPEAIERKVLDDRKKGSFARD